MPKPITADCLAEIAGVSHGFFTREGGVSQGIYAGLNCGHGSADDPEAVRENRARVARALGATGDTLLTCYQIHSASAVIAVEPWSRAASPKADAIVTNVPGLAVGALAADCAPVLLADPEARVVAAVHAGWKGALTGVLDSAVATMERIGARRGRIRAALGPCIGPQSYEVGPDFMANFTAVDRGYAKFFNYPSPEARPFFDLPAFVLSRLEGLALDTIENCTTCTYADESRLYSYRRTTHRKEGDYGRQISAIVLH